MGCDYCHSGVSKTLTPYAGFSDYSTRTHLSLSGTWNSHNENRCIHIYLSTSLMFTNSRTLGGALRKWMAPTDKFVDGPFRNHVFSSGVAEINPSIMANSVQTSADSASSSSPCMRTESSGQIFGLAEDRKTVCEVVSQQWMWGSNDLWEDELKCQIGLLFVYIFLVTCACPYQSAPLCHTLVFLDTWYLME